VLSWEELQRDR